MLVPVLLMMLAGSFSADAQDDGKDKKKKMEKDVEQIIITKKGDKDEKFVIEINGDKVTINGKDVNDFKEDDVKVLRKKFKDMTGIAIASGDGSWNMNWNQDQPFVFSSGDKRALLGVGTENADEGVLVTDVNKESAAEKAGLKKGDIITKIDDKKIESPDELTKVIRDHKPGDKVTITYLRDKKEASASAELGEWGGLAAIGDLNITVPGRMYQDGLRALTVPGAPMPRARAYGFGQNGDTWNFFPEETRLGLSVQDTEDGKGVKVLDVDDESNAAKAGIKEDDIITEFAGKEVNSADQVAKLYRETLTKKEPSVPVKILRNGKSQNLSIKVPRKLKTAEL